MKNTVPKMDVYETLYRLNRGFEIIVMNCCGFLLKPITIPG